MIRATLLLAFSLPVAGLCAGEEAPASKDDSNRIRMAIVASARVNVYEGLPHGMFERELLAEESKRKDTEGIGSYRFYSPAVAAADPAAIKRILSSAESIRVFEGEKLCGGFHPDYAVEWFGEDGSRYHAQICFGCHEIIYSDGKKEYRYDLENEPFQKLRKELAPYAKKRPRDKG